MAQKIIIVGGVAGGASAAARLRRLDETAEIILLEKGPYISFANCGLPYHVGGVIAEREQLLLQTPESFEGRFNIPVRTHSYVSQVNPEAKTVTVEGPEGTYTESYDKLILSPGSTPIRPPISGIDQDHIHTLWTIPELDRVMEDLKANPTHVVVAGGGFVGLEVAENLVDRGFEVSLVEMQNQVMAPLDLDMAQLLHNHLREKGVRLYLEERIVSFQKDSLELAGGKVIPADFVIMSLGVRPQTDFLKGSSIALTERGAIIVSRTLQTNYPDIYAIGDAATVTQLPSGKQAVIPLAGPANKQGRMAADNIVLGNIHEYKGSFGTGIAKVFDMTAAAIGLNEKALHQEGKVFDQDYLIAQIVGKDHAGYYPGAMPLTLKVLFDKSSGLILGAQGVGYGGVDKRIDVIATAMKFGGKITDLKELELAYAPPYSSAKDPVNMIGFLGENLMNGLVKQVHVHQLKDYPSAQMLDVRNPEELVMGTIGGAINIPLSQLRSRLTELDPNRPVIINCAIGLRGYIGTRILSQHGFREVYNLAGGYSHYNSYFCTSETKSCAPSGPMQFTDSGRFVSAVKPEGSLTKVNVTGLQCPGPIVRMAQALQELKDGDVLEITATDPGFIKDLPIWCERTGHRFLETTKDGNVSVSKVQKVSEPATGHTTTSSGNDKTIVVFSGDLDKAIASLIIANGAASMGRQVTMFYTFWGLNILRRSEPIAVSKKPIEKAFGLMMPRGTGKLGLSRMNFAGMGGKLIKKIMKDNHVDSLETMLQQALASGVRMIACNMSMDLMGIKEEELIDGVELGGVASYLGAAETADTNLFI